MKRETYLYCIAVVFLSVVLIGLPPFSARMEETLWEEEAGAEEAFLLDLSAEEDLAEGYIRKKLYPKKNNGPMKAPRLIGSRLEGINQVIYAGLYEGIEEAAAGLRTSTVFTFPFETLYEQRTFTAEELGMDAILVNGAISQEAKEKAKAMMAVPDYAAISQALMADCPYELYWFNKTDGGMKINTGRRYGADQDTITVDGTITISLAVSQDYAAGAYQVDPGYGQAVSAAAERAQAIVEQYAEASDAEKLLAYKDEICALASYHEEAENGSVPYGNPWQLIWVFDGDPETRVICEGYAKALQYLCDLSSEGISVISVSGKLDGANHMWNIAQMEDGKNYLIDLTNCDSGMAGYPDALFLAGAEEGNVNEGYTFSTESRLFTYQYAPETPYSAQELKIAYWSYAAGGPPSPEFQASAEEIFENEQMLFSYLNAGYSYDEFTAEITFLPPEGESALLSEQTVDLLEGEAVWAYEPLSLEPGQYSFRFAGSRDGTSSPWTEPVSVRVADIAELVPTYRFSTAVGYAGYRAVVRITQQAQGVRILETGEEYPCLNQDALIPLGDPGEKTYTLALIWNGKVSAGGEAMNVSVLDAPDGPGMAVPDGTLEIEEEAFRGAAASVLIVPDSVERIGKFAFADNAGLLLVEIGAPEMDETAFENCVHAVFCPSQIDWGFDHGVPFVQ